jgi:hypothetical protein
MFTFSSLVVVLVSVILDYLRRPNDKAILPPAFCQLRARFVPVLSSKEIDHHGKVIRHLRIEWSQDSELS